MEDNMRGINNINTKRWGVGTLSLIISIFSVMFSFSSLGEKTIGENILKVIGVKFPVMVISTVLFVIAIFIGHKYKEDYGAKFGKNISISFIILMMILSVISSIGK
jgi:hypothetical protein